MECEGTSQRADGFTSEHTTWRVTISALQAVDAALKPLVGLHRNTCQRLQISGFFLFFSFFLGGGWMKNFSIQRSDYIPGLKHYVCHHE